MTYHPNIFNPPLENHIVVFSFTEEGRESTMSRRL